MSGGELVIDTNIILYALGGDDLLVDFLQDRILHVSFITELELLGYAALGTEERRGCQAFLSACVLHDPTVEIKAMATGLRRQHQRLKLQDALIAATAMHLRLPLLSADRAFRDIPGLHWVWYRP